MNAYKLRAECRGDVMAFVDKVKKHIHELEIVPQTLDLGNGVEIPIPDVVLTFKSALPLDFIQRLLYTIVDSHVMFQTVALEKDYTGERKDPIEPKVQAELKTYEPTEENGVYSGIARTEPWVRPTVCAKACEPRPMYGRSWWKCQGYNTSCGCAWNALERAIRHRLLGGS